MRQARADRTLQGTRANFAPRIRPAAIMFGNIFINQNAGPVSPHLMSFTKE
jgi:hypothetical protein